MVRGPAAWRVRIGGYGRKDSTGGGVCKAYPYKLYLCKSSQGEKRQGSGNACGARVVRRLFRRS